MQTQLLGGKDIYKQAFSSPLPSLVDGLQTEAFGEGGLPEGLGEISLFEDQRHMAACATSLLHGMLETLSLPLKRWELCQHQVVLFTSPPLCLVSRELVLRNRRYSGTSEGREGCLFKGSQLHAL